MSTLCEACGGAGVIGKKRPRSSVVVTCTSCKGSGRADTKTLPADLPAHFHNSQKLLAEAILIISAERQTKPWGVEVIGSKKDALQAEATLRETKALMDDWLQRASDALSGDISKEG